MKERGLLTAEDDFALKIRKLDMFFESGSEVREIFKGLDLSVEKGCFLLIRGPSGCGKSTLLKLIAGFLEPRAGEIFVEDRLITQFTEREKMIYRNRRIGFVYQDFRLISCLNALENVMVPLLISGMNRKAARQSAGKMLECVGLTDRAGDFPGSLSGGQAQRTAIARAMVRKPFLLLADEPTASLDRQTSEEIWQILKLMCEQGTTLIAASHDPAAEAAADRVVTILPDERLLKPEKQLIRP